MTLDDFLDKCVAKYGGKPKKAGAGFLVRCPVPKHKHGDRKPSLSVRDGRRRLLIKCFTGCDEADILAALDIKKSALVNDAKSPKSKPTSKSKKSKTRVGRGSTPSVSTATVQPSGDSRAPASTSPVAADSDPHATVQPGCTLAAYAEAKKFKLDFLKGLGLTDCHYLGKPAVRTPYFDTEKQIVSVQFRIALDEKDRFRWRSGDRAMLYGLDRLAAAKRAGYVVLVEGPSDAQTLWYHKEHAVGVPGAATFRPEWATYFDGIETLFLSVEPGQSGETFLATLSATTLRDRIKLIHFDESVKDPSALHVADPGGFVAAWRARIANAVPLADYAKAKAEQQRAACFEACKALAIDAAILDRFESDFRKCGVVGETKVAKLLFLVIVSRLLDRPVSAVVKGPSSAGKSYVVERVLGFFSPDAFYALSSMSERALAYSDEPMAHRVMVIYESAGLASDFGTYLMRSLLSEHCVRYETVEKGRDGLQARLIEREGPTGLVVTTTKIVLDAELETRLLTLGVTDTREHTGAVLGGLAKLAEGGIEAEPPDFAPWHALDTWLATGPHGVVIPYATVLAKEIPPIAVRLRRDFSKLLALVQAHALMHQQSRERDAQGRIVATVEDYAVVRELVADVLAEGIGATVPAAVRETVKAVETEIGPSRETIGISVVAVAKHLKLDKSAALRRVRVAIERGYLRNAEEKKGRPARLVIGDPLPDEQVILPLAKTVAGLQTGPVPAATDKCASDHEKVATVAGLQTESGGYRPPLPPSNGAITARRAELWALAAKAGFPFVPERMGLAISAGDSAWRHFLDDADAATLDRLATLLGESHTHDPEAI